MRWLFGRKGIDRMKIESAKSLWQLQETAKQAIIRGVHSNCISPQEAERILADINRSRLGLQDKFLLAESRRQARHLADEAQRSLNNLVQEKTSYVKESERAMPFEERITSILANFDEQVKDAARRGKIDRHSEQELQDQARMYSQALRKSINDPRLRESIRVRLVHEYIDDFHRNVSRILDEAVAK